MKKLLSLLLLAAMLLALCACAASPAQPTGETTAANPQETSSETSSEPSTLVYGSGDYTRINPAMDEHCEINLLLFDGLTAHDGENNVVPGLAESWDFDEQTNTYTFHLKSGVTWHDGEPFTAADVKFTIEAIMNPDNGSENAPNFEDVEEITVADDLDHFVPPVGAQCGVSRLHDDGNPSGASALRRGFPDLRLFQKPCRHRSLQIIKLGRGAGNRSGKERKLF